MKPDYRAEAGAFMAEWLADSPCITAHTSGSTGAPKAVSLTKEAMRASARRTLEFFGIRPGSVLASALSARYIAGKMMMVRGLEGHCECLMLKPSRSPLVSFRPHGRRLALLAVVPQQLPGLARSRHVGLVDRVLVGGAPLQPGEVEIALSLPCPVWESYGMTETCSHVALRRVARPERGFTPLPGVDITIDADGRVTVDGLVTNDLAVRRTDGTFTLAGRLDDAIISGGIKLHPTLLEQRLRCAGFLRPFMLLGAPSARWGTALVALVTTAADADALTALATAILAPHERPKHVTIVAALPTLPNGKPDRAFLARQLGGKM